MKFAASKRLAICTVSLVFFLLLPPALAHHGTAGYDPGKTITLTGTVSKYDWSNPHVVVYLDVKDPDGKNQQWALELAAPLLMARYGWSRNSIKPGDQLIAEVHPAKNGAPIGIGATANMLLKWSVNGKPLPHQ